MILPATGIWRLARFRADGLAAFDATPQGLLNALAPWLAITLVATLGVLIGGDVLRALTDLCASVAGLLAPLVVGHALARWFGREDRWLRFAVAMTWVQWVLLPAGVLRYVASFGLMALGFPDMVAEPLAMLGLFAYLLGLNLFVARRALELGRWRSVAMVLGTNLGTAVLVLGPALAAWQWQ